MVRNCNFDNILRVEPKRWFEEGVSVVCNAWSEVHTPVVTTANDGSETTTYAESEGYNEDIIVPIANIEDFDVADITPVIPE